MAQSPKSKSKTPWTVITTKRTAPTSAPPPRKRRRLSFDGRNVSRTHQQTLTQIQFGPYIPSLSKCDNLEPIEIMVSRPSKERRKSRPAQEEPREPGAARTTKAPKKQRSTLTQMDFLTMRRQEDDGEEDHLGMITYEGGQEVDIGAEKENIDAGAVKNGARAKRKIESPLGQSHNRSRRKKRKIADEEIDDHQHPPDTTPRANNRGGRQRKVLSEKKSDIVTTYATTPPTTRTTRAMSKKTDTILLQAETCGGVQLDEKGTTGSDSNQRDRAFLMTPQRKRDVIIPSSQSPESASIRSKKCSVLRRKGSIVSPLEERSMTATPTKSLGERSSSCLSPTMTRFSSKRKICVLKYGPGKFSIPRPSHTEHHDVDERLSASKTPRTAAMPESEGYSKEFGGDRNASSIFQDPTEPEIPETSQNVQLDVIPSSQTDNEEEVEIPETSQGLRRVTSTPSLNRSEESLRMLSNTHHTLITAQKPCSTESHDQLDPEIAVQVHDYHSNVAGGGSNSDKGSLIPQRARNGFTNTSQKYPATVPRLRSGISTIDDSQDEDCDGSDLPFELPAITRNDSGISSRSIRSDFPPPPTPNPPSSPSLPPAFPRPPPSYPSTTTLIPTKLPPSSSFPPSSPKLPPQPRPTTTQQSIHPASMPRPSQVSTQASALQSWLPMSSMPFAADNAMTSSPYHNNRVMGPDSHVIIKDSSSSSPSVPLRDIPSQVQSHAETGFVMVDLGLDNPGGEGDEDLDARDEDLDPKSSPVVVGIGHHYHEEEEEGEGEGEGEGEDRSPSQSPTRTNGGQNRASNNHPKQRDELFLQQTTTPHHHPGIRSSPANSTTTNPHAPPLSHNQNPPPPPPPQIPVSTLNLPDSLLESLPAPPGWHGVSDWEDDEMI